MSPNPHLRFSPPHTDPLNPSSALYRVDLTPDNNYNNSPFPHSLHPTQMDHNPSNSRYTTTCIPSLFPPGVDPTSVDFRTFFPYIPNEVKHRKRTSRTQLKVLEDIFRKDTKPNAALRKKLAAELDMLPRAVQVWFQNRRAKDKNLRKRVQDTTLQDPLSIQSPQKSQSSRDTSPIDSSNSSTPTEKPTHPAEDDQHPSSEPHPLERSTLTSGLLTKLSPHLAPLPLPSAWYSNPATPAEIPPHVRPPSIDVTWHDNNDLLNARRGSLPITISMPNSDMNHLPTHFPDRRKSMDVNSLKLMHHPFARVAKEKNDVIFPRSPLSPTGSAQSMTRPPSVMAGQTMRATSYGSLSSSYSPYSRPYLGHRASEPHVFTPTRSSQFSLVPDVCSVLPPSHMSRQLSNHHFATSSRAIPSPIPGPLPKPDFQFGAPSSTSPPHASPEGDSPNMHSWEFPRNDADQDTDDSVSFTGLSRFGSIASACGSDASGCGSDTSGTSAIYSEVSSCVGVDHLQFDPNARRGSCASNSVLETRMSGLNMRSSQGSLNEAHLNAASSLAYQRREHLLSQQHGYISPTSTASPGSSPHTAHGKDPGPFGETSFGYNPVPLDNSCLGPTESAAAGRRSSVPTIQEEISHNHIRNTLENNSSYTPTFDTTSSSNTYHFSPESSQYSHAGNYTSPAQFPRDGAFPLSDASYSQSGLQYEPESNFPLSQSGMGSYVQSPADYSFVPPAGHGQDHFSTYN